MNPLGIHALVWTQGWSEDECRRAVALTKESGYDLIEIPLLDPSEVDASMTRDVLEEAELGASCSLGLGFDTDVSSADSAVSARGEELLAAAIVVTSAIGASFLGGVLHSAMGKYLSPPTQAGRRHCVEALKRLGRRGRTSRSASRPSTDTRATSSTPRSRRSSSPMKSARGTSSSTWTPTT